MEIDRRVRAKEFMMLMSIGRTKFYRMIKNGEIPQPIKVSEKEVFWHELSVKKVVEKHKDNSDMIAC
ncbi:AlpA family phage regulatory protein [Acinetobacter nosocomialis]|uniref:helix-turn-helix transcriptional regulator n=1 Tax=Acinetobacter nosocomialis TaxID=106654 RepID=UPI00254DF453|nr:AlpA family phage regulatory protein [Acinetobacter nosocomialis]MEC6035918.1 AlpA family phage regulatory protein [Acinetobacter nosocomialis]